MEQQTRRAANAPANVPARRAHPRTLIVERGILGGGELVRLLLQLHLLGVGGLPAAALVMRRRRAHPAAAAAAVASSSSTCRSVCGGGWSCAWSRRRRGTVPAPQAPWCGISCAPFCMGTEAQGDGQRNVGAGWAAWVLGLVGAAQHALRRPPSGSQHSLVGQPGRTLRTTCDGSARCGAAPQLVKTTRPQHAGPSRRGPFLPVGTTRVSNTSGYPPSQTCEQGQGGAPGSGGCERGCESGGVAGTQLWH